MIENIKEFCQIGREVICDNLQLEKCTSEEFERATNLVINEFSNYQILSLLINEKLPKEKNNIQRELLLIDNINFDFINENILDEKVSLTTPLHYITQVKKTIDKFGEKLGKRIFRWMGSKGYSLSMSNAKKINNMTPEQRKHLTNYLNKRPKGKWNWNVAIASALSSPGKLSTGGVMSKVATIKKPKSQVVDIEKSKTGKLIGGLALATMIGYGAYKIYKNYLSKAARACAGKPDKTSCMKQYKINAIKAQISKLNSDAGKCSKSKDPVKCKASIQNKINKLKSKLA